MVMTAVWVDFALWNCNLQTGGKITWKVGTCRWEIVNYTPVGFWHVKVQYTHCMELDGGGLTS